MNIQKRLKLLLPLSILHILLAVSIATAAGLDLCGNMQTVVNAANEHCNDMEANQACAGAFPLIMENLQGMNVATQPGSQTALNQLSLIEAQSGGTAYNTGIAKLHVTWDNTVEPTEFFVFGGVQVRQELPTTPVISEIQSTLTATVRTNNNNPANLRAEPGQNGSITGTIPSGASVRVLERSADSEWVLVRYSDDEQVTYAWIAMFLLQIDSQTIPFSSPTNAPFQSFDVTATPTEPSDCGNVPSGGLILQSPQGSPVHFKVNGVLVYMGSTVLLRPLPDGGVRIINLEGNIAVRDNRNRIINVTTGTYVDVQNGVLVSTTVTQINPGDAKGIQAFSFHVNINMTVLMPRILMPGMVWGEDIYICDAFNPGPDKMAVTPHSYQWIVLPTYSNAETNYQRLAEQRSRGIPGSEVRFNGSPVQLWGSSSILTTDHFYGGRHVPDGTGHYIWENYDADDVNEPGYISWPNYYYTDYFVIPPQQPGIYFADEYSIYICEVEVIP